MWRLQPSALGLPKNYENNKNHAAVADFCFSFGQISDNGQFANNPYHQPIPPPPTSPHQAQTAGPESFC